MGWGVNRIDPYGGVRRGNGGVLMLSKSDAHQLADDLNKDEDTIIRTIADITAQSCPRKLGVELHRWMIVITPTEPRPQVSVHPRSYGLVNYDIAIDFTNTQVARNF
jgi:hypothetical protein